MSKILSYRERRLRRQVADINITPFVDVVLVLLVIFMLTAPMMTVGVKVDLPKTQASHLRDKEEPIIITVRKDGTIYIQETPTTLSQLASRLGAMRAASKKPKIFIRGDKSLAYGAIMEVMGSLSAAGYNRMALIGENEPK